MRLAIKNRVNIVPYIKAGYDVLSCVHRKTRKEMQGAYELLKEMLSFFIEKSFFIWETNRELKKAPGKKDRVGKRI